MAVAKFTGKHGNGKETPMATTKTRKSRKAEKSAVEQMEEANREAEEREARKAIEPRKVTVQIGLEVDVEIGPDADEFTMTKINELKKLLKLYVENDIQGHWESLTPVAEGAMFGFNIKKVWY